MIRYLLFTILFGAALADVYPVVLWHGMGDTCCFPFSLGAIKKLIEDEIGAHVKSLEIGGNLIQDYESGFFKHPNQQIEEVCSQLANDTSLANGFNAIGFSRWTILTRFGSTLSSNKHEKSYLNGGPTSGHFWFTQMSVLKFRACEYMRKLLNHAAYDEWVQKDLVQATYWHDPLNDNEYRSRSTFLSDINNEVNKNERYSQNLFKLQKFVMVKFLNDTIVQPKESQWFEFYRSGQDKEIQPLRQSSVYDNLSLRDMELSGKLKFLAVEGDHLQFNTGWFIREIIPILRET